MTDPARVACSEVKAARSNELEVAVTTRRLARSTLHTSIRRSRSTLNITRVVVRDVNVQSCLKPNSITLSWVQSGPRLVCRRFTTEFGTDRTCDFFRE